MPNFIQILIRYNDEVMTFCIHKIKAHLHFATKFCRNILWTLFKAIPVEQSRDGDHISHGETLSAVMATACSVFISLMKLHTKRHTTAVQQQLIGFVHIDLQVIVVAPCDEALHQSSVLFSETVSNNPFTPDKNPCL